MERMMSPPTIPPKKIHKPRLCGPGPCDISDDVYRALSQPMLSTACPAYYEIMDDIRDGLKYAFQTDSKLVFPVSGSGHAGMETVISNLLSRGQMILFASRGIWDERAKSMAQRYGLKHAELKCPPNTAHSHQDIEFALQQHRPDALFIVHGDSSTGTIQQIKGLGELCRRYNTLLIVDTVVTLCGVPFFMDEWKVDAVYTSLQKCMGGPAGITPVAFGPRAEAIINNRNFEPPFYFDAKLLAAQWKCYENKMVYHHTLSPPLVHALRACLVEIINETLEVRWARHAAAARRFHLGLKRLNLEFFVQNPEERLDTVTTIVLPDGYDLAAAAKFVREKHDIVINTGLGPTVGKTLRIGLLAINATEHVADLLVNALEDVLAVKPKSKM